MQEHLFDNFNEKGNHRFLEDVSNTFIDKTNPSEPLKRENYWKRNLKTMVPLGLNIEDSIWNVFRNLGRHVFRQYLWIKMVIFIIYYNYWRSLLKVFLRGWLSCSCAVGIYWNRDAILVPFWWVVLESGFHWGESWRGCFFNNYHLLLLILLLQYAYLYIYLQRQV